MSKTKKWSDLWHVNIFLLYKEFQEASRIRLWYHRRGGENFKDMVHMLPKHQENAWKLSSHSLSPILCWACCAEEAPSPGKDFFPKASWAHPIHQSAEKNGKMLERIKPNPQKLLVSHIKQL